MVAKANKTSVTETLTLTWRDLVVTCGLMKVNDIEVTYWSAHPGSDPDNSDGVTLRYLPSGIVAECGVYPTRYLNELGAAAELNRLYRKSALSPIWRHSLTADDLATIERAKDYAVWWNGIQNNSPLILIAKLVAILDGEHGR